MTVALLASLALSARASVTEARVVVVKGTVTTTAPASSQEQPAVRNAEISVGSSIGTAQKSSILMEPTPGSAVMVLEQSKVVLTADDLKKTGETIIGRKTFLNLSQGKVQAALAHPQNGGVDFKIKTPQCVAAARGTVYSVTTNGNSTTILVGQGSVVVTWTFHGKTYTKIVSAGQELTVFTDGTSTSPDVTVQDLDALRQFAQEAALLLANDESKDRGFPGYFSSPNAGPDTSQTDPGANGTFPGQTSQVTNK